MAITQTQEAEWLTLANDRCKHWGAFRVASALAKLSERGYYSGRVAELAQAAEIDAPNLGSAIDQLEDHGFVTRLRGDLARQGLMLKLVMPDKERAA